MFRKKTRGQVIGAELQEAFAHIGVAASEAGSLAVEQLGTGAMTREQIATLMSEQKWASAVAPAAPGAKKDTAKHPFSGE